jgi:hypothetical protein
VIKLRTYVSEHSPLREVNFRYATALMIEARIRGFPLMEECPAELAECGSFNLFLDKVINWLIDNFPGEFQKIGMSNG